jgi:acetylornithine deacetylase
MLKPMKPLDPLDLTRRLVDIESLTYNEGAVGAYLDDLLRERGFAVERTAVPQPPQSRYTGERFNLYAGSGERPDVVLSTHMDTVPPFIPSSEDDLFIYGRGSCDAKGIIAAQLAAAERLRDAGVAAGLLFVVGEERDSAGALIANLHPQGSRFLINGEPTDNRLALASKGVLRAEIRASGTMAHSAYPELGDSAVHKLVHALERLLALELPTLEGVGPSTLNIGVIHGGHAPNVIADIGADPQGYGAGGRRTGGGGVHPGNSLHSHARGGRAGNHGRGLHDRYSRADQLGRAAIAWSRIDSCGAYAV